MRRRTTSRPRRPSRLPRTTNSWSCYTSTPGFPGDIGLAQAIKTANPNIKIAFVGPHVTVLPESILEGLSGHRFRLPQGIRLLSRRIRQGQAAGRRFSEFPTARTARSCTIPTVRRFRTWTRCPTSPTSTSAISILRATTCRSCCIRTSRSTPRAAARRSARSACGRRRPADIPGASAPPTTWPREMAKAKEYWPGVKEFFFDDDTFNFRRRAPSNCARS